MAEHKVEQGETILSIAHEQGFGDWQRIWDHADNATLRDERPNPMVLKPGDVLQIPDKEPPVFEADCDTIQVFRLKTIRILFSVHLRDEEGKPYSGCRYQLKVGEDLYMGKTGDGGLVSHEVAPTEREGTLRLWYTDVDPEVFHEWQVQIGHLDPVDTTEGVQARLNNLGFNAGPVDGTMNDKTKGALKDFQRSAGLEPTGEVDDPTREALKAAQNDH